MRVREITGSELTNQKINAFNAVVREAYDNPKLDSMDHFHEENVYFYVEHQEGIVAFGCYVRVDGIVIDGNLWPAPVHGRSLIAVLNQYRGRQLGKLLVTRMREYAEDRKWSQVGIHGKSATVGGSGQSLSHFYAKCGLQVDETIGEKMFVIKDELFVI